MKPQKFDKIFKSGQFENIVEFNLIDDIGEFSLMKWQNWQHCQNLQTCKFNKIDIFKF